MFLNTNNTRLYYEQTGSGTPLILLHGNGEDHKIFDKIIPLLSQTHTVYAIDSRGHGQSAAEKTFDYQTMANDIVGFIEVLDLQNPVLYGFSDGGIIGLLIASQHPNLLGKLIVSGVNINPRGLKFRYRFLFRLNYLFSRSPLMKLMITQPQISKAELSKIAIPTVIIVGEKDLIKIKHTRFIAQNIANSKLEIVSNENHGSYVIDNIKLYEIIKPFL